MAITSEKIYQPKNKIQFLKDIESLDNQTINQYNWIFKTSYEYEMKFNRDIFDFNKKQMMEFLGSRKMSVSSLYVTSRNISYYINYTIKNGIKFGRDNVIDEITKEDLATIETKKDRIIHAKDIEAIVGKDTGEGLSFDTLPNYQDRVLVYLAYMGVLGKQFSEIRNLKYSHIDFENKIIKLSELDPYRKDIRIDDFGIYLLKEAKKETDYTKFIEDRENFNYTTEKINLVQSDYVIKKSMVGNYDANTPMSLNGLKGRLQNIYELANVGLSSFKILEKSGMVYFGKLVLESNNELKINNPVVNEVIFNRYNITNKQMQYRALKMIKEELQSVYGYKINGESDK